MTLYREQVLHTAQRLLEAVQKEFANQGVTLPDRQFLYAGSLPPADFDDQDSRHPGILAVGLGPLTSAGPGVTTPPAVMPQHTRHHLLLRVWIFRAVATITDQLQIPTPTDMTADAQVVFVDTAILASALEEARRQATVNGLNVAFAAGPVQPVTVQGGFAGCTANVDVDLIDPGQG